MKPTLTIDPNANLTAPSGTVKWRCLARGVLPFTVEAQTWFFARQEASAICGVEPGMIEVTRC